MPLAALYRDIVEKSPDAMWVYDLDGKTIYANPAMHRLMGVSKEEMLQLTVFDSLDELGKVHFAGHLADLRQGRFNQTDVETQFVRADGSIVWVIISESELRGPDGEFIGVLNRLSDYSDRRATLDNLTSARRRLDEAQRIARIGSWEWELDQDEIWGSKGLQALYGLGPEDFPTTYEEFLGIVHEDDRQMIDDVCRTAVDKGTDFTTVARIYATDGTMVWTRIRGICQVDEDGVVVSLSGTHQDITEVNAAVLRYAREVAFATAAVYARAAEVRGAWDARLEALVVDAVLRSEADETLLSRASALGWTGRGEVAVVLGEVPADRSESDTFEDVRRIARAAGMDALCAVQGDRLVVVLGGVTDPREAAKRVSDQFGDGPVVVGPVADDLAQAYGSARAALSAHRAAVGWPEAPRPVLSSELLPERALAGDGHARRQLVEEIYLPVLQARGTLIETLASYFQHGSSIEATARALFVHANTVRYRLRQVAEISGFSPTDARDAFTLEIALVLGRQSGRAL